LEDLYDKNKYAIKPIGLELKNIYSTPTLNLDIAKPSTLLDIPPWQLLKPKVDTSLSEYKKSETNPVVFKQKLSELKQSKRNLH
jgi:hypothetical protein